jgi:hypothetical protein
MVQIGCLELQTKQALLATCLRSPSGGLPERIGLSGDSFVAFPFLSAVDVPVLKRHVSSGTLVAACLSAFNFDPIEDHPEEPDFLWTSILLEDFSDINDDLGMVAGVRGGHFQTLLSWRPRVDPKQTASIAMVAPGSWNRTIVHEGKAIPALAHALAKRDYDGIAVRCKAGDDREFDSVIQFAEVIRHEVELQVLVVAEKVRSIEATPFSLMVREARSWSALNA